MTPKPINLTPSITEERYRDIEAHWLDNLIQLTGCLCNVAALSMLQARDELKAAGLLRRETAYRVRLALGEWRNYDHRLTDGDTRGRHFLAPTLTYETKRELHEWWTDIGAQSWQRNARQIELLRMQYHNAFTAGGLPHPRELSWLALTAFLWNFATAAYTVLCNNMRREWHIDLAERYSGLCPVKVAKMWANVGDTLRDTPHGNDTFSPWHQEQIHKAEEILKKNLRHDYQSQSSAMAASDDHLDKLTTLTEQENL